MVNVEEWKTLMEDTEAVLDPELEEYLYESDFMGPVIQHPLVFAVPYFGRAALANRQLEVKKKALAEAEAARNWSQVIWLHERPFRAEALVRLLDSGVIEDDAEYWHLVEMVWTDTENLRQWEGLIRVLLDADRPGRSEYMMDDEERAALAALPDTVTIYRGYRGRVGARGWSWTTDYERAMWFAKRFANAEEGPRVARAKVDKDRIIALILGRGENEVIADPDDVRVYRTQVIHLDRPVDFKK